MRRHRTASTAMSRPGRDAVSPRSERRAPRREFSAPVVLRVPSQLRQQATILMQPTGPRQSNNRRKVSMYTARSLVSNFLGNGTLLFRDFRMFQPGEGEPIPKGFESFCPNRFAWFYERKYDHIPSPHLGASYGRIPLDFEDAILLMRLYRPGDLSFSPVVIEKPDGTSARQDSYRTTVEITGKTYRLDGRECSSWDSFADSVRGAPAWKSDWFSVARRFFLYAGAKEFNAEFDEIDRMVDYAVALEACVVPESDFIGRRLRERCAKLAKAGDFPFDACKLTKILYDVRSTVAHGGRLDQKRKKELQDKHDKLEFLVRFILRASVLKFADDANAHKSDVQSLWDVTSDERVESLMQTKFLNSVPKGKR
jgi:hypothetical protein